MRTDVLGVGFDDETIEQAVSHTYGIMHSGEKAYLVTPNPEIVWMARRSEPLRSALGGAELVLPDGIGIVIGARILGTPLHCGRVAGIDFISGLFEKMAQTGGTVYLLGAKPGVAAAAAENLAAKYAGLNISGTADGYFTNDEPVIERINAVCPDLLLVCLGAPKQELWMAKNRARLNAGLCAGLGGVLDVFAGTVKRAPAFFQRFGIEWLYRLIQEPRRIKRMAKLPLFIFVVMWKRIRGA